MRILVLLVFALLALPVFAQEDIPADLAAQMDGLERFATLARRLDARAPVPRAFPTRAAVRAYLEEVYGSDLVLADIARSEAFYKALWMLPPDADLRQTLLTLLGSQVAGFYDTETQMMNVIPTFGEGGETLLTYTEQIIYVHEFVHALQDQHFDLDALLASGAGEPDASLAVLALVEGDATAVMNLYSAQIAAVSPNVALQLLAEGVLAGNLFLPPDIPAVLVRELAFPYENGLNFVLALWREGGWEAVNAAYGALPTTTEQILHPEAYLAGDAALMVEFDAPSFGADCETVWDAPMGEFYLREHLRSGLDANAAARAAAGWGGDRLKLYRCGDAFAWMLRIEWDTPADAGEFTAAYESLAAARYGGDRVDGCWRDAESSVCLNISDGGHTIQYVELG